MKDSVDRAIESELNPPTKPTNLSKTLHYIKTDEELQDAFCYNSFSGKLEHKHENILLSPNAKKGTSITDYDIASLRVYLSKKYGFCASKNNLEDALVDVSFENQYHPVKDYLEGVRWDGLARLDTWLPRICGAQDSLFTRAVSKKLFIAACKRIYEPGCTFAQLTILEGRQRIFKSRLVRAIGGEWYASIHLKTKDTKAVVEDMAGKWWCEIEEMAGFSRQETEHMKAFVSRQTDRVRLSYGRHSMDFPRQSVMVATMNPDIGDNKYLNDSTGNVRYWPIKCGDWGKIKIDEFLEERDQLFAEAMTLFSRRESVWLDNDEQEKLAEVEQEKRMTTDPWGPVVVAWLNDKIVEVMNYEVTTKEIAENCLNISKEKFHSGIWRRIGRILAQEGWIRGRESTGKNREWYYSPPETLMKEANWDG